MPNTQKSSFKAFLEKELNESQRKAVTQVKGPTLVIAGAGSGKTRVITARITHLIADHNVEPSSIVALTFTNKAANEMKERITQFLGSSKDLPFIGTFHSYCVRILKKNLAQLNLSHFSILDGDDQKKMLNGILHRNNMQKQITARNALYQISQIKNQMVDPQKGITQPFMHPFMQDIYNAYEEEKRASKVFDFDDLLLEVLKLFKTNDSFRQQHQENIRHILVDEYQDTNVVQHELLKQMALDNNKIIVDSLCAVGDEDQSIYSWRGATVANILNYQKDFKKTKTIKIEQNYRSVQPILDAANAVITQNINRNPKTLWSAKKGTDRIRVLTCVSEYQEGDLITQFINAACQKQKRSSIAILYRTHAQSRAIEEALLKNSIPYKIIGGVQFYDRKEVKDLLAYLRLVVNPFDRTSFFRIINCPGRGLGPKFEEQFYDVWHNEPFLTFTQVAQRLIDDGVVTKTKKQAVEQFINIFDSLSPTDLPSKTLETIIQKTGYIQHLKNAYEQEEAETRIENTKELIHAVAYLETQKVETIDMFLEEVALMQDKLNADDDEQDKVLLMTLHAAKGLEFDTVILAGLEEGIMPTARAMHEDDAIEEERRLLYVGITRAKERLILMHAKYRYTYGKMVDQMPSRFLYEVPQKFSIKDDCSYWNHVQQQTYFNDWLGIKQKSHVATYGSPPASLSDNKPQKLVAPVRKVSSTATSSRWKKNQPVSHKKYGVGIIQKTEKKDEHLYVTVRFKTGTKKIIARFLQPV